MGFVLIAAEEALTCSEVAAHGSGKERVAWVNFDLGANTVP